MLHAEMGQVTVRVGPRLSRTSVGLDAHGILIRVQAAPEHGRATEGARRALAEALGVPESGVSLRRGERSRTKVFEVEGLDHPEAEMRLRATRDD